MVEVNWMHEKQIYMFAKVGSSQTTETQLAAPLPVPIPACTHPCLYPPQPVPTPACTHPSLYPPLPVPTAAFTRPFQFVFGACCHYEFPFI